MSYPRLAALLYNRPLLIEPGKAELLARIFEQHVDGNDAPIEAIGHLGRSKLFSDANVTSALDGQGYYLTDGGIAVVPIIGTLVQRAGGMDALSGLQSYNSISGAIAAALADTKARGIALEIDSPGGDAAGLFDLAAQIREANQKKPVWAAANEYAFSAAYAIGAAAERLSLPESGSVGSVGVIMMHVDQSAADQRKGYKFTPIFAGARKADFSSHAPLGAEAKATAQQQVDALYEMFVNSVAEGRNIDASIPRGTEGGLLNPQQAKTLGMADAVEPFRHTLAQFRDELNSPQRHTNLPHTPAKGQSMTTQATNQPNTPAAGPTAEEAARASAQATADATAAAAKAATQRVQSILGHAEAAERQTFAKHIAFNTSLSVEEAAAMLVATPKEAGASGNRLDAAMRNAAATTVDADSASASGLVPPKVLNTAEIYRFHREQEASARAKR